MKKNKLICVLLCTVILLCAFSLSAFADTGPKPSVNIEIAGIKGEYYATLLSKEKSTGPASAWDGTEEHKNYTNLDPVIWEKFTYYKDSDGFYFLQQAEKCYGNDTYKWGYYPPKTFKVLVYIPESDTFIVSEICERYAFDSYFCFEVSKNGAEIYRNYDYTMESVSLAARVVLTIALELALALLFGYRARGELLLISCTNIATQLALNIALNAVNFHSGQYAFVAWYIMLEFAVFALEAAVYFAFLPRLAKTPKKRSLGAVYALLANTFSFALGLAIANMIPGIF